MPVSNYVSGSDVSAIGQTIPRLRANFAARQDALFSIERPRRRQMPDPNAIEERRLGIGRRVTGNVRPQA
jgi:hypothetical protein